MSNMQTFHEMLTNTPNGRDHYVDTLVAITKANHDQLNELSSDLIWQTWSAPAIEA